MCVHLYILAEFLSVIVASPIYQHISWMYSPSFMSDVWLCSDSRARGYMCLYVSKQVYIYVCVYLFFSSFLFFSVYSEIEILNIFGRMFSSQGQLFSLVGFVYYIYVSVFDYLHVLLLPACFYFFFFFFCISKLKYDVLANVSIKYVDWALKYKREQFRFLHT